ncbi:MAG: hypothetical protein AAB581_01775 [Patescibacteria group bacterium]
MDALAKADIFFFITAIAVVVISVVFVVALVYVIRILHRVDKISERFKQESGAVLDDVAAFRAHVKAKGVSVDHFISRFFKKKRKTNH